MGEATLSQKVHEGLELETKILLTICKNTTLHPKIHIAYMMSQ